MYSLVNTPTLVRDLARHPRAAAVVDDLLRGFALDEPALDALESLPYDDNDRAVRADILRADADNRPAKPSAVAASVDLLERTRLGSLSDLIRFVRHDVLADEWTGAADMKLARRPRALDVITDGVLATAAARADLGTPWRTWVRATGAPLARASWDDIVSAVAVARRDAPWPAPLADWAVLVHDACWAVHLSGRERAAAVTQLRALTALLGVFTPDPPPLRAVAVTVAAVHAHVAADLLPADTHLMMTAPLFRLLP